MNYPTSPDERPPYLDRCKEMEFGELRKFIDYSLERLEDSVSEDELPRSKEEFLELVEMLGEKAGQSARDTGHKPQTQYGSSVVEPPGELELAYERWNELRTEIQNRTNRGESGEYHQETKRLTTELRLLEQRIKTRERYGQKWPKGSQDWKKKERRKMSVKDEIVERIRSDIEDAFKHGTNVPTERLRWRILPQGESSTEGVRQLYAELQRSGGLRNYDEERLNRAFELGPDRCYVESKRFDGYIIFTFPHTSKVLMECLVIGNAIYVIGSDWERWSKMTKQDLMADTSGEVKKIVHQGDWFGRVKQELGSR